MHAHQHMCSSSHMHKRMNKIAREGVSSRENSYKISSSPAKLQFWNYYQSIESKLKKPGKRKKSAGKGRTRINKAESWKDTSRHYAKKVR